MLTRDRAHSWAFSSFMPKSQLQGKSYYDPGASSTSKKQDGQSWTIQYGDGSTASGTLYTDRAAMSNVTAGQQGVQTATKVSDMFLADVDCDGSVGLGFSDMNRGQSFACSAPRAHLTAARAKSSEC